MEQHKIVTNEKYQSASYPPVEHKLIPGYSQKIGEILKFIRLNSLITKFRFELMSEGSSSTPFVDLLNFGEENFGLSQLEVWLNIYETENPFLAMLKRPNLKKITLAKFLKEIQIWKQDGNGYPVKDGAGMQMKRNLIGTVKIQKNDSNKKQPIIELENENSKVTICGITKNSLTTC